MQKLKNERQTLENAASKLLSLALKDGAGTAEICAAYSAKTKISLEKQDYHMATSDDGYSLGLRVITDGKQAFVSGNSLDGDDLKEMAAKALEIINFSPRNPNYEISASENIGKEAPANLWDDQLHDLSLQTQKDWTKLMMDEAIRDTRFRMNEGSVTIASAVAIVMNSLGTHKVERETDLIWSLMGMAVEGETITSFDYFQELSRVAKGVPDRIVGTTKKFRDNVIQSLKSGKAQSYKGLVMFSPRAVGEVFSSNLAYHLNGRNVVEGTARWKLDDLNKPIINDKITLQDMPWLSDRFGCSTFDREGTPTRNMSLIQNGILKNFMLDHYAAKALKLKSTGHAAGGTSSVPVVSTHCLVAAGGTEPLRDLVHRTQQQQGDFLVVHRFSGQVDPITGDFSGVAKGGEWWHNGERAFFVTETLISGNIFECLGSCLFGLSRETEIVESQEESPTFVIDNVSVTSA